MNDPSSTLPDPDRRTDDEHDPEAPRLTDLENPEPEPGTDIVPPAPPDPPQRREGVVCDPDATPHAAPA
jgi:hypothetical protein